MRDRGADSARRADRVAPWWVSRSLWCESCSKVGALAVAAWLVACADAPLKFEQPIVLLGEVHDNAVQHGLRLRAFEAWLADGARPALVMEQFDRERQGTIDDLRTRVPAVDAAALIAAASDKGWEWRYYRPFVALALLYGLPIVAANVSRDQARAVMRQGLAASGFNPAVDPQWLAALAKEIEASHCGTLNNETAQRMALAQVARDQAMAAAVEAHAERGVLLLAGNGHVRIEAVPRWLSPPTRARSEAIGLLELGGPGSAGRDGRFDRAVFTPVQPRSDPCATMRR